MRASDRSVGTGPGVYLAAGSLACLGWGLSVAGLNGGIGTLLVLAACLLSVLGLGFIARTVVGAGAEGVGRTRALIWAMAMLVLKLPVSLGGIYLGWRLLDRGGAQIGPPLAPGLGPLLAAIGLVYSATVWNLASRKSARG